jgi:predicted ATPase
MSRRSACRGPGARLEEARLRAAEAHFGARIEAGETVVGDLEALLTAYPLHEGLWQLLITALYKGGRQGEALEAYRRARERLADELGIDPGPALRDLQHRILVQAPVDGNLPALTAPMIGRQQELAGLLREHRLVTLVGPAGVGKTRLALEVARGAGGWLVRLESAAADSASRAAILAPGAAGPALRASVWQAIGEAFDVAEATEVMVLDRLRGHRTLLVLDNCEHLLDRLIPVVERLLSGAPGVTILATSQVPLRTPGEIPYALEPLPPGDAEMLFRERASRHRPIGPDEDVGAVCRALDGLPLAIELAAARAKALPVPEIARRLDDRFALLTDPNSRLPARQRTLRAAIGWSYELLFPDDQRGLWALACFTGGAPLDAGEHVLQSLEVPAAAALDVLDRLVDRSLATAEVGGDAVRYRLLDSVRAYAGERIGVFADTAAGARVQHRGHADAHQHQPERLHATPEREQVDGDRGGDAADDGAGRDLQSAAVHQEDDDQRAARRAHRQADEIGTAQRVRGGSGALVEW